MPNFGTGWFEFWGRFCALSINLQWLVANRRYKVDDPKNERLVEKPTGRSFEIMEAVVTDRPSFPRLRFFLLARRTLM
jgi:hypothetical protein